MASGPTLETERLFLRRWRERDRDVFAALNADSDVMEFSPGVLSSEESGQLLRRIDRQFEEFGFGLWAVDIKWAERFIGFCGLAVPTFQTHFTPAVEIGWRFVKDQWGNGYATEAAKSVLEFGFEEADLGEILSWTVPANQRSQQVMRRLGMQRAPELDFDHPRFLHDDRLRRHVVYRVTRSEWGKGHNRPRQGLAPGQATEDRPGDGRRRRRTRSQPGRLIRSHAHLDRFYARRVMATHIELVDTATAPEETLRAMHALYLTLDEELLPGDPPVPWEQRLLDWRYLLESEAVPRWALWKGPEVVATSGVHMDLGQNLDNALGWVYVHPRHRGSGYGREIATPMFDVAEMERRTRFAFQLNKGRPEEELARRAGMKSAYREKLSRLSFPNVDWALMETWVERAAERATDYELLFLPSPIDEQYLEPLCELQLVMNTAPREDYEEEDEVMTPGMWRDTEAKEARRARDLLTYVARHNNGVFAGYTTVAFNRLQPDLAWQWDTGVDPRHRNKGLGRWLKAAMAVKLRSEYPTVRRIDTYNAGSNEPMLNINIEMGFRPILVQNAWQGDLATLRERLSI